jgi:hypothetical protein
MRVERALLDSGELCGPEGGLLVESVNCNVSALPCDPSSSRLGRGRPREWHRAELAHEAWRSGLVQPISVSAMAH